jgi:hypothetical protein
VARPGLDQVSEAETLKDMSDDLVAMAEKLFPD